METLCGSRPDLQNWRWFERWAQSPTIIVIICYADHDVRLISAQKTSRVKLKLGGRDAGGSPSAFTSIPIQGGHGHCEGLDQAQRAHKVQTPCIGSHFAMLENWLVVLLGRQAEHEVAWAGLNPAAVLECQYQHPQIRIPDWKLCPNLDRGCTFLRHQLRKVGPGGALW
mmetsp:Transcript_18881/g.33551  ORF Transcript_18881/g.33551 Transcript_18881/m.33551 type:complete len:169 (+) Transcript_18881:252-758(+)